MTEPRKTIIESTFELLAGYTVNRFYNDIYANASESFNRNSGVSITTTYLRLISTYSRAIDDPQFIPAEIKLLHEFYQIKTAFTSISLRDMEDKICCCFVPPDHFGAMTSHDKDRVTVDILAHMIKLTAHVVIDGGMMSAIIDDRTNSQFHVRKLMDMNIAWLSEKRENLYKKFASRVLAAGSYRHIPHGESPDIVEKMRAMLSEKIHENAQLATFKEKIERVIPAMKQKIAELTKAAESAKQDLARGRLEFERAKSDYEARLGAVDESSLRSARAENLILRDENGRLKADLMAAKMQPDNSNSLLEISQLRSENSQVKSENARLQAEHNNLQAAMRRNQSELESIREELDNIKKESAPDGLLDESESSDSASDSDDDVGLRARKKLEERMLKQ